MRTSKTLKGAAVMLALAAIASGCASGGGTTGASGGGTTGTSASVKRSSAKTCAAHGGTYNAATKSCSFQPSTTSAQQMCQQNDGYYDEASDICSYNP